MLIIPQLAPPKSIMLLKVITGYKPLVRPLELGWQNLEISRKICWGRVRLNLKLNMNTIGRTTFEVHLYFNHK